MTAPLAPPDAPSRVEELQARIRGMQATRLDSKTVPTHPAFEQVLPGGSLREGTVVSVEGSTTLLMALLAGPSASGRVGRGRRHARVRRRGGLAVRHRPRAARARARPRAAVARRGRGARRRHPRGRRAAGRPGLPRRGVAVDGPRSGSAAPCCSSPASGRAATRASASRRAGGTGSSSGTGTSAIATSSSRRAGAGSSAAVAVPDSSCRGARSSSGSPTSRRSWASRCPGRAGAPRRVRSAGRLMAVDLVHVDPTRTIVLWCPDWPVFAACRESGLDPEAPVALTEGGQIYACSAAARRDGVVRGLKLREAQYRSPGLTLLDYDASLDVRVFEPVVRRVEETVPGVQLIRPGTLAMRARGPARYYGGEEAAARALLGTVAAARRGGRAGRRRRRSVHGRAGGTGGRRRGRVSRGHRRARGIRCLPRAAAGRARRRRPHRHAARPASACGRSASSRRCPRPTCVAGSARQAPSRTSGRGREQARVARPHAAARARGRAGVRAAARAHRPGRLRHPARAPTSSSPACAADRLVCTELRVELDATGASAASGSGCIPRSFTPRRVVDRVRWQLQGAGTADSALHSPDRAPCASRPSASIDRQPRRGDLGRRARGARAPCALARAGDARARRRGDPGDRRRPLARRAAGARAVGRPGGARAGAAPGPWPGACPTLPGDASSPSRLPVQVLDAGGAVVTIDARGVISATPGGARRRASRARYEAWAGPWPVIERGWDAARARRAHRFQVVDADGSAWLLVCEERGLVGGGEV